MICYGWYKHKNACSIKVPKNSASFSRYYTDKKKEGKENLRENGAALCSDACAWCEYTKGIK